MIYRHDVHGQTQYGSTMRRLLLEHISPVSVTNRGANRTIEHQVPCQNWVQLHSFFPGTCVTGLPRCLLYRVHPHLGPVEDHMLVSLIPFSLFQVVSYQVYFCISVDDG